MTDRKLNRAFMNQGKSKGGARLAIVDAESAGRRIDNFLLTELPGLPRTRVYSMIRKGEVRVNKGRIKANYRVKQGDQVRIPPVRLVPKEAAIGGRVDWIESYILHEDERVLVLNKPSGLAVHGGSGISRGAIEMLRANRQPGRFLELVHRLDRDTSGVLLFAKKRSALRDLHAQFRTGQVEKIYLALLLGCWAGDSREVSLPLVVEGRRNGERHVRPGPAGKEALTRFFPEQRFSDCTLARVELMTGRTHQIRVHAAAIGHPVAGDSRYGEAAGLPEPLGLKRLFLHAASLSFVHPGTGAEMHFEAPLDPALAELLTTLKSA